MNTLSPNQTCTPLRNDLRLIADLIEPNTRVLDVGCGDGALIAHLSNKKSVDARGIEISQEGVNACVALGLSVIQGDADTDLVTYPENAFDYVILGQTLQATRDPKKVIQALLRIGENAVVSFVNFGHWRNFILLAFQGRMPVPLKTEYHWFNSPDIHLCTIKDFVNLCDTLDLQIKKCISLNRDNSTRNIKSRSRFANLFSEQAIFLLKQK
ncbi:MAG: methionine biosynthesis protein MetW [Pseudomonadota bacterium]|nr:methionine biosynthesis protein MetW [Pseudomonadota bacterium]